MSLQEHLQSVLPQDTRHSLRTSVLPELLKAIAGIAKTLRQSHQVALAGTTNAFGDDQLNVDVSAENHLRSALAQCPSVATASSEEHPVEVAVPHTTTTAESGAAAAGAGGAGGAAAAEKYTVAFDPLDGSSIIAPNWSVGAIIGIWDGESALHQSPRERQVASVLGVFGPRTTALVAVRVPGGGGSSANCFEAGLLDDDETGTWQVMRPSVRLLSSPKTRYFAPANLRAASESEPYMALVTDLVRKRYTLRYSGGLVPDVVHALVKGHGVYVSPVTAGSAAKLRRLYELCPVALILECAGGAAIDPADGMDVLERPLAHTDERGGLVCGNVDEVEYVKKALLG